MSTVIHKIDLVCRMLREAGNPEKFEGVHSTLMQAKGRIEHLEAQLAATETMRDRAAMQILPMVANRSSLQDSFADMTATAYRHADTVMQVREGKEPAGAWHPEATQFSEDQVVALVGTGMLVQVTGYNFPSKRYIVTMDVSADRLSADEPIAARATEPTPEMLDAACAVVIGFSGDRGTHNDYLDRQAAVEVLTAAFSV